VQLEMEVKQWEPMGTIANGFFSGPPPCQYSHQELFQSATPRPPFEMLVVLFLVLWPGGLLLVACIFANSSILSTSCIAK